MVKTMKTTTTTTAAVKMTMNYNDNSMSSDWVKFMSCSKFTSGDTSIKNELLVINTHILCFYGFDFDLKSNWINNYDIYKGINTHISP